MNPANYSLISFPSLGIEVNPGRTLAIGPLTIHYYGAIIAAGLLLAMLYSCKRGKKFGLKEDDILDGFLWVTPFAIVCARIYYVAFSWADYRDNPISVFYIWEGGIAIYGGVLGAVLGMWILCKVKKLKFTAVLDLILRYPNDQTAFFGFFMLRADLQGCGVGSSLISEILSGLSSEFRAVRLGYVKGNEQSQHFWQKNGFLPTGVVVPTESYEIIIMEREL